MTLVGKTLFVGERSKSLWMGSFFINTENNKIYYPILTSFISACNPNLNRRSDTRFFRGERDCKDTAFYFLQQNFLQSFFKKN